MTQSMFLIYFILKLEKWIFFYSENSLKLWVASKILLLPNASLVSVAKEWWYRGVAYHNSVGVPTPTGSVVTLILESRGLHIYIVDLFLLLFPKNSVTISVKTY